MIFFYCSANEELSLVERFSKSHSEREKILQQRKESMLSLARKRYDFFFQIAICVIVHI